MGTGFAKKKKQARMMQDQLSQMQDAMQKLEVTGTAGNGLVSITLTGEHALKDIKIKPECVDSEDVEGLQDLIKAAYGDALKQIESKTMQQMPGGGKMGGFPGLAGMGLGG